MTARTMTTSARGTGRHARALTCVLAFALMVAGALARVDAQMPDIAKAAKVGVGTVYRHFPTKDDLIEALVETRFARIAEWMRGSDHFQFAVALQSAHEAVDQLRVGQRLVALDVNNVRELLQLGGNLGLGGVLVVVHLRGRVQK